MDRRRLTNIIYKHKKHMVFNLNPEIYIREEGEFLVYSTFFSAPHVAGTLNRTAKVMLALIDGKRTVGDVFECATELFQGVERRKLLQDLLALLNRLEREGVLESTEGRRRRDDLIQHARGCCKKRLRSIRTKMLDSDGR